MKEPKAHVNYLKELNEEDYRRLINEKRYHDLLGVDPNSSLNVVREQWKELKKQILEETTLLERSLLADISNAVKQILQKQPVSGQDKEYEEKGKEDIFNNPQHLISPIAFSCLSEEDKKNLAILIGQKIISPDRENLPDGDKIKEIQKERNKGIADLIKAAGIRQEHFYAQGCNLINTPSSPILFAEFELLPQEDKIFFAIYLGPYLKHRLNDVNRERMLTLIDAAKNESYYKIGESFLPQVPGVNLLQDQDKRFLAIVRGKKERKITLSPEEVERERLLEQRLQTELVQKEQTEQEKISTIKEAVKNDNKNHAFKYASSIDWFLSLPGKEKEHFKFLVLHHSRANNNISEQHLQNYLNKDLSEEEFTERFEPLLAKAKGYLADKIFRNSSYLERYLQKSGSSPCPIERIQKVLNSPFITMLKREHWERIEIQHYNEFLAVKFKLKFQKQFTKIPKEAIEFISDPTARALYDILQNHLDAKDRQELPKKGNLRAVIKEIELKIGIPLENSILETGSSAAPQAAASHSFSSGTLNSNNSFSYFQVPPSQNSLAGSSTASPPSKRQRTG